MTGQKMSKRLNVRIPDELYEKLVARAAREMRTLSNLVIVQLTEANQNDKIAHKIAHTEGQSEGNEK